MQDEQSGYSPQSPHAHATARRVLIVELTDKANVCPRCRAVHGRPRSQLQGRRHSGGKDNGVGIATKKVEEVVLAGTPGMRKRLRQLGGIKSEARNFNAKSLDAAEDQPQGKVEDMPRDAQPWHIGKLPIRNASGQTRRSDGNGYSRMVGDLDPLNLLVLPTLALRYGRLTAR